MFGDVAVQLIKMLGASGAIPGAIGAQEIPAAVARLRERLQSSTTTTESSTTTTKTDDDRDSEPPIALATRAVPLIDMLQRAAAADAPVMWEKA